MTEKNSFADIQRFVDSWITQHGGYWSSLSMMCAIIEEVGEVAREINSLEGYKPKKKEEKGDLAEELGDLLFSIICLANNYKINLKEAIIKTMQKYSERDAERFSKKPI